MTKNSGCFLLNRIAAVTALSLTVLPVLSELNADEVVCDYYPQEEMVAEFLNKMPWQLFKMYSVPNLGSFWVDDAKDCVKDTIKLGQIWETHIIDVLTKYIKPGDQVVDIGAHMGTITMAMSNLVGETGMVHSFEGERQFFRELVENIKLNQRKNIKPYLCWVSNEEKEQFTIGFFGSELFASLYSPVYSLPDARSWNIHVRKLDSFNLNNITLMKIDVECAEDSILLGAKEMIMSSRPIIVLEIMGGFGWRITPDVRARIDHTISILNGMNYTVQQIHTDDYLAIPNEKL